MKVLATTHSWVKKPDPNNPNEHLADDKVAEEVMLGKYALEVFWFVARAFRTLGPELCRRGEILPIPERVVQETELLFSKGTMNVDPLVFINTHCLQELQKDADLAKDVVEAFAKVSGLRTQEASQVLIRAGCKSVAQKGRRVFVFNKKGLKLKPETS